MIDLVSASVTEAVLELADDGGDEVVGVRGVPWADGVVGDICSAACDGGVGVVAAAHTDSI
jgi:hypothetical protein